jgi:hypothetical protein
LSQVFDMQQFITSSAMTRLLANIFIFLVLVASLIVAAIEVMQGQPINPLIYATLSMGMVYAATILGMHSGVIAGGSGNGDSPPPLVAPLAPEPTPPKREPQPIDITRYETSKVPVIPMPPEQSSLGLLRRQYQERHA